jgi:glycosyltransferase involved in cell wall biosynthesis
MSHPTRPRIAYVTLTDPAVSDYISGMPHQMWKALSGIADVTPVFPGIGNGRLGPLSTARKDGPLGTLLVKVRERLFNFDGTLRVLDARGGEAANRAVWTAARRASLGIRARIEAGKFDAVVGVIMPWLMIERATNLPTVYFTDTVTANTNEHYPVFKNRPASYRQASMDIEERAYRSVDRAAFPARFILDIAIAKHGLDPERGSVIHMGANIYPAEPVTSVIAPPTRDDLRICMIGSDPARKRTDLAVEVIERLRADGIAATLTLIGPPTPRAQANPNVRCVGKLQLGKPDDRATHEGILRSSHWLILPSLGEGAAIAPAEAAHFGVPSIVSNAGGTADVVADGVSGIVLPLADGAESYAARLAESLAEPSRHTRYAEAALDRAHRLFTWSAWGKGILDLIGKARSAPSR